MGESTGIRTITFEAGFIILTHEGGQRTRQPIADVLRALDIPVGLTYTQVGAVKTLANIFFVVMKALMERGLLEDGLFDGYDLPALITTLEDMGGDFGEPDLTVT